MRVLGTCLACFAFWAIALPTTAQQADDLETLNQAQREARKTETRLRAEREQVARDIAELKAELARDTEQTQAFERQRLRLSERVSEISRKISELETELQQNRAQTLELFAALQRLQLAPNAITLADPEDAVRTAQAATMIDLLSSQLQERADVTIELAEELGRNREEASLRQRELDANAEELLRRRQRTEALVAQKEALQASIRSDEDKARAEAARLAAEASSLRELLERVSAIPDDIVPRIKPGQTAPQTAVELPPGTQRFAEARGGMVRPVSGRMSAGFGRGERGQTYSARGGGQVIAPYAGRVEFVGPFRNHGRVVILNLDDGYYLLLTGLGETYVDTNETVRRGEPLGLMPGSGGRTPLYIELRRNGRSIDPEPWMGGRS